MGAPTNLNPTSMSLLSCTSWSLIPYSTNSPFALQKSDILSHVIWATMDVLNHVPIFSRQDNWMYQTTCPHSTNQLQFHSTKGHHNTLYGSNTPHFKQQNSCNIFSYYNYTSNATLLRIWELTYIFYKMVCDRFFTFSIFSTIWHTFRLSTFHE